MKKFLVAFVGMACSVADAALIREVVYTAKTFEPGTTFQYSCWAPEGLEQDKGAVYLFLEHDRNVGVAVLEQMMRSGAIPLGIAVFTSPGTQKAPAEGKDRYMRAEEYDQPGTEFPNLLVEEIVPDAERALGIRASRNPDLHFIAGVSSGGIAAWNACWYRNDFFRRCYCNSPTFSNVRGGNQLMPLVRKCETRPIRVYMTCGTFEPDYYFGDSYFVAEDAAAALRFAGYEVRFDRLVHAGHAAKWNSADFLKQVLTWLFEDWDTKHVTVATDPIRVRNVLVRGSEWEPCSFKMPSPVREVKSTDQWRVYSVSPTNRFVMSRRITPNGERDNPIRLAPLELPWNVSHVGGTALALAADDRLWVATELGVQGVVTFGLTDVVLPLPDDLPCDNVALVGNRLYASSGEKVFCRTVAVGAAIPRKVQEPMTPEYDDGFWYAREHEPAGGICELLGSYLMAGRVAGVVSALSDPDYNETFDCVGWAARYGQSGSRKMTPDTLFAVFSMSKTFLGAAMMCAIDEGRISLDDEVSKYLPEFAEVRMKDGSRPRRALTIRDMTCHVNGFRGGYPNVNRDLPMREVARRLALTPLETQPGVVFDYGTATIDAAGACLEIAVGCPYEVYLKKKILDPLGMADTTFKPNESQQKRLAQAYTTDDGRIRPSQDEYAPQLSFPKTAPLFAAPGGGLFSTARDMIRFSQMLAHHGLWKGKTIISRKTFDAIFAVKQTPDSIPEQYTCGCWLEGDWFGHEGAMRTDQRANLRTGHSRVFFVQTENAAGSAFFQLKRDWHAECDKVQGLTK